MKMKFAKIFTVAVCLMSVSSFSQEGAKKIGIFIKQTNWTFGLGNHIVVDGGKETSFPFDTKAWNYLPYPTRITVEGYLKSGWSMQTEVSYNQYKAGNIVDKVTINKPATFVGTDFNMRFAFSHWYKEGWFDPYVALGVGYTYRSGAINIHTGTNNVGIGTNFWIYKGFGLNLHGMGKFVMKGGAKSNYTHYSVGLVYKKLGSLRNLGEK